MSFGRLKANLMMKNISLFTTIFIAITALLFSCKKEPNDGMPIYLKIDTALVYTNTDQGSASHKITDVWVTANGRQLGAFQLPTTIPILASGDVRIIISAGIKDNGIANSRAEYPFYTVVEDVITDSKNGETYSYTPQFTYAPFAKINFKEDFESSNGFTNMSQAKSATEDVFEGTACGKISLSPIDSVVIAYNTNGLKIPFGQEVYLEMDYKCDNFFEIGLILNKDGGFSNLYKITLNPKDDWNKIYINLSNEIGVAQAEDYRLYFKLVKIGDASTVNVLVDNIKIVNY
jgi:hypothetical protein